jgi:hypothetical protein
MTRKNDSKEVSADENKKPVCQIKFILPPPRKF